MEQIERALVWVRTVTAGVLVVAFGSIEEAVAHTIATRGVWMYVLAFVVSSVLFRSIEAVFEAMIENSRRIRRWIVGKHFIEGYWKLLVRSADGNHIHGGILLIYYEHGKIKLSGDEFNRRGQSVGALRAVAAEYGDGVLGFVFESAKGYGDSVRGASTYVFTITDSMPTTFRGESFDSTTKAKVSIEGQRIVEKNELEQCMMPSGDRGIVVQAYMDSRESND